MDSPHLVFHAFVLNEDGGWEQPSFRVPQSVIDLTDIEATEERIRVALLDHYGRKYFAVFSINPDFDNASEESIDDLDTWGARYV